MDKSELLATLRTAHAQLRAAIDALSDDELALPAQGEWTRRDLIAHVEWWELHAARVVEALCAGLEPYDREGAFDLDAQNARVLEESRGRSAADVRQGEAEAWSRLLAVLEAAPEQDLVEAGRFPWTDGEPLVETVRWDTDRHWAEHLPHLGGDAAAAAPADPADPA
jgi:hypothetical protein